MSGGVGPTGDSISLPTEEVEQLQKSISDPIHKIIHQTSAPPPPSASARRRFLSLRQLNALAAIVVLSASGMVAATDTAFAVLSVFYVYFLSSVAFPTDANTATPEPPVFGERNLLLAAYVSAGALVGLVLPIAYILEGVFEGDKEGIKAAAPHVFLLACQVFMEGVTFSRHFSLPMRAFVPILYNSKRLFTIAEWVGNEVGKAEEAEHGSGLRLLVGQGLAVANMAFWSFNLFGFLLPVYLPRAFKRYYSGKVKV